MLPHRHKRVASVVWRLVDGQNRSFTAIWTTRGSNAVVIVPKFAAPNTAFGAPRFGVFSRLKTSARTSITRLAPRAMRRMSARSTSRYEGPRTGFRDDEPIVNCGATAKAAVLNH